MKRVVVLTVHYRNVEDTRAFLASAARLVVADGWRVDLVVVDNSGDAPRGAAGTLFASPANLGYLGAAAFGLDRWRAENGGSWPEWLVITNSDVEFAADALEILTSRAPAADEAVLAPNVLLRDGTPQNPFMDRRPRAARMWAYTVLFRSALLTSMLDAGLAWKRRKARKRAEELTERDIYAPHGSVIFLHRTFFERGGTLHYPGFMYGEEIHIAEQARSTGSRVVFVPAIRAYHRGGSTTGKTDAAQRRRWHLDSAELLWRAYFRRGR
jgi:GT2 family glycosyltransferase